jgi:aromatic ring-opening dioxygenase catalytic subunit (LigB family)
MYFMLKSKTKPLPYIASFDSAPRDAIESDSAVREDKMAAVYKRGDAKQAHPFADHLMPVYIAAGLRIMTNRTPEDSTTQTVTCE